jgi:N-methylhydantoinase B
MGASRARDGLSATAFPTNSGAGSIEALEAVSPLLFRKKELRADSGGVGRQRGGLGQDVEVANITEGPIQLTLLGDRERHPALGLLGGGPGAPAEAVVSDGRVAAMKSRTVIAPGQSVTIRFAGGGGYGPPAERPPAAIAEDLRQGFVSAQAAARDYPQQAQTEKAPA